MEKNKEAVKKPYSDIYAPSRVGLSKKEFFKHTSSPSRSDSEQSNISYFSRTKNTISSDRKYTFYGNETKSYVKHCTECVIKTRPHLFLNPAFPPSRSVTECSHDLNTNASFNACSNFYSLPHSTSDASTINQVLSCQSSHYELSAPKSTRYKQKTNFTEQRPFISKNSQPNSFFGSKRYFSLPKSRFYCSRNFPQKYSLSESQFKVSNQSSCDSITALETQYPKYDIKYIALPGFEINKDVVKLTDLPAFVHSDFSTDPPMTCKIGYIDQKINQHEGYSNKWNHTIMMPNLKECSKSSEDINKMLFPALPNNQQSISSCPDIPLSENAISGNPHFETSLVSAENTTSVVSSSIPQASYADVIRMSATTCSEIENFIPFVCNDVDSQQNLFPNDVTQIVKENLPKEENSQLGSSNWVISRLSDIDLCTPDPVSGIALNLQNGQNVSAPRSVVVSLEKPSFYNSSLQTSKSTLNTLPSNANGLSYNKKGMENDSLIVDCLSTVEKALLDHSFMPGSTNRSSVSSDFTTSTSEMHIASIKTDSVYDSPSSVGSFDEAFQKTVDNTNMKLEKPNINVDSLLEKESPVIIMNNFSSGSMPEISFGIEYEEMMKLCSDEYSIENDTNPMSVQHVKESLGTGRNDISACLASTASLSGNLLMPKTDISVNKLISVNGKKLYWEEPDINYNKSNLQELTEYLSSMWNEIENGKVNK